MQVDEHGPKTQIKSQKVTADATKNINFYYWVPNDRCQAMQFSQKILLTCPTVKF